MEYQMYNTIHPRTDLYINPYEHRYEFWKVRRHYEGELLYHEEELISFLSLDCTRDQMARWICSVYRVSSISVYRMVREMIASSEEVLADSLESVDDEF